MSPLPPSETNPDPFEFGPVGPRLEAFNKVVRPWLASTDVISNRVAIGMIAAIPMADRIDAHTALQFYIPSVKIDAEHTRDLLYRINRPKRSRSLGAEVELNRMTTWGVIARVPAHTGTPPSDVGGAYVSVECDNSTPAEQQSPLDKSRFVDIYDELTEMALQNLELGELP